MWADAGKGRVFRGKKQRDHVLHVKRGPAGQLADHCKWGHVPQGLGTTVGGGRNVYHVYFKKYIGFVDW